MIGQPRSALSPRPTVPPQTAADFNATRTMAARPETSVYLSDVGYFCIKQNERSLGEVNLVMIHPDEITRVIGWLNDLVGHRRRLIEAGSLLELPDDELARREHEEEDEEEPEGSTEN